MKKIVICTSLLTLLSSITLFAGAVAGVEQEVFAGERVTLDGSESFTEKDGKIVRYNWKQITESSETPIVDLRNRRVIRPTFISPKVDEATILKFRLRTKEKFKNRRGKKRRFKSSDFVEVIVLPKEETVEVVDDPNTPNIDIEDDAITNFQEISLNSETVFRYNFNSSAFFTFTIEETTKVKIIASDNSSDSLPAIFLREGLKKSNEVVAQDVHVGKREKSIVDIEITLEPGIYSIEATSDSTVDGILELLSL